MTYLIDNFLKQNAVTAIYGRPSMNQSFIAEDVAFAVAAGVPLFGTLAVHNPTSGGDVVFLVDGAGERSLRSRRAAWCAARGVKPEDAGEIAIVDIDALRLGCRNNSALNAAFYVELAQRVITPALIVSSTAATSPMGFVSPDAQAEISLAQYAIGRSGAAILLAGHVGPQPQGYADALSAFDALWKVDHQQGRTTLTQGGSVIELTCREGGGHGHVVTRIFDAVKEAA